MDGQPTWTDCDEAGDYVVPNVLSPRNLVSRPDIMDETVPHTHKCHKVAEYPYICPKAKVSQDNVLISVPFVCFDT